MDGAFVALSMAASGYWPTVIFELAHETVHLLDPIAGYTNWLEEGIAVDYSIYAQFLFGLTPLQPEPGPYMEALQLVRTLPGGSFSAARVIREKIGALSSIKSSQLQDFFPDAEPEVLSQLCETCIPR